MKKPWSISTTVRNPERIRDFLIALKPLSGQTWNTETQEKYQKLLIKHRLYGFGSRQFYNGLPRSVIDLVSDTEVAINDEIIEQIIEIKNYRDFPMRGRQSINPLTKFGFASIYDGIVSVTKLGQTLIERQQDFGDVFLRSFIKWQIPNPASDDFPDDGTYDVVPFVATLKLIDEVNRLEIERGNKPVGLQKREFSLFVPSLTHYANIAEYARRIIHLRDMQQGKSPAERKHIRDAYRNEFVAEFLGTTDKAKIKKCLANLHDYGDNTIRYFRLTKFIRIRGGGFYVDIEPNRRTEIDSLFEAEFYKSRHFADDEAYLHYMADDVTPQLPWATKEKLNSIAKAVEKEVHELQEMLGGAEVELPLADAFSEEELIAYIEDLRRVRYDLQEKDNHVKSQPIESIDKYIESLETIFTLENRPLMLEYFTALGLHALNDARQIKPNYPVGDDNEPTSTAPAGMADIECFYDNFSLICEVTMLKGRDQWFNEGQPVMRHLRNFENLNARAYCLFIAPTIHGDTAETFWVANTFGYKGTKQNIAPLTIVQFVRVLRTLRTIRNSGQKFHSSSLEALIQAVVAKTYASSDSDAWLASTDELVATWCAELSAV